MRRRGDLFASRGCLAAYGFYTLLTALLLVGVLLGVIFGVKQLIPGQ